jgi:gluconolactonase
MHVHRRFRSPSGFSNGNTFDREGRQIAFRHFHRDVLRYERDGKQTVLAARGPTAPSTRPTTAWSTRRTARSGSPTPATAR